MKRVYTSILVFLMAESFLMPVSAQNGNFDQDNDFVKSFYESRKAMMDEYAKYRNTILMDYDNFLREEWKQFNLFKADKRPVKPKPKEHPKCTNYMLPDVEIFVTPIMPTSPISPNSTILPRPDVEEVKMPQLMKDMEAMVKQNMGSKKQQDISDVEYKGSAIELPLMPPVDKFPVMPALPNVPLVAVPIGKQMVTIDFYGEQIQMQQAEKIPSLEIKSRQDVATYWQMLKFSDLKDVIQTVATESRKMGLSDWASAMLVEKYIEKVMPTATKNEQVVATQYVLANCGYNVRLAMSKTLVSLLVPYAEHVYEKTYIFIDGKRYYVYPNIEDDGAIYSCELPKDAELGKDMELRFAGKTQIGDDTHEFHIEAAGISLVGEVPVNAIKILDDYPIIDIPTVASSVIDAGLRDNVVEQVRSQVQGLGEQEAANRILNFVQKGFQYATDAEQFNREKYFYFEETLYYPMCDCEDRAIFYAYLVHEVLGLDVHLIQFPGHECTAVAFNEPVEYGTSYEYDGKRYYICDPTYIGARIGRCMPSYAKESPQIEVWY